VQTLGIPLKVLNVSEEYLEVVKHPKHGYGSNMNPCIDCRIFMMKKTKQYMREAGASFVVTGEVLGQRPMSQRKDAMRLIDKEADLEGLILRPLSARLDFFQSPFLKKRDG
jgi:tRNA U34 2-thiouridine synthase MnmA/TrmU